MAWASAGAAVTSAGTGSEFGGEEATLAWGCTLAGDWTLGGDWLPLAGGWTCAGAGAEGASEAWVGAAAWVAGWGLGEALEGGGVWGFGWSCGFEFLRTGGMGFAGGVGLGGSSLGLPGAADGEPWGWGLGCSVVGAEAGGDTWAGAEAKGESGAAAAAALAGGEPGAAAALAGDDGEALTEAGVGAGPWADLVTDGALVIGGGLGTGGFVTEVALWTGPGFWDEPGAGFWAWLGFGSAALLVVSEDGSTPCGLTGAPKKLRWKLYDDTDQPNMPIHIKMFLIHRNPNEVICKEVTEAQQVLHVWTEMTSRGQ